MVKRRAIDTWKKHLIIYFLKHYKKYKEGLNALGSVLDSYNDHFQVLVTELQKPMNQYVLPKSNTSKNEKRRNIFIQFFIHDLIMHKNKGDRDPDVIYKSIFNIFTT